MSSSTPKVLIAGSGPAGLVLALCLLKHGISVRIIEKDEKHHNGERGCGVQPRTLELEHFLENIDKEVTDAGYLLNLLHIYNPKDPNIPVKKMPFRESTPATPSMPETRSIILGQWKHQQIIRKHVEAQGCFVELGTELIGIEQDETFAHATLSKTSAAGTTEERSSFDLVVGADGARSFVRHAMGVSFEGETRQDARIYIVDARMKGNAPELEAFHVWGDQSKQAVMMRGCNEPDLFQIMFMGSEINFDNFKSEDNNVAKIQEQFNLITGKRDLEILNAQWQGEWRPNLRIASTFRKGRLFIVGDAAHTHSPTGGQGLNTSVQDSINLAWKMSYVLKGLANADILDSYSTERVPVVAEMLNITTDLYKKTVSGELARQNLADVNGKEHSQPPSGSRAWISGRALMQLDINYRWSSIVFDERFAFDVAEKKAYGEGDQVVRAGDRAPDAPELDCLYARDGLTLASRIFDILNATQHTGLIFADNAESAKPFVDALKAFPARTLQTVLILRSSSTFGEPHTDFVVKDTAGHAFEGYDISTAPAAVVIRPDSWIGAVVTSVAGVEEYVSKVFKV